VTRIASIRIPIGVARRLSSLTQTVLRSNRIATVKRPGTILGDADSGTPLLVSVFEAPGLRGEKIKSVTRETRELSSRLLV
jgi:hypothetical protein